MQITETNLKGLFIIEPRVFHDERGYFYESYNNVAFDKHHIHTQFVQDNQSMSMKGALRGLHFQKPPHAQAKLVRVTSGAVYDVVVDIRKDSDTFGQHFGIELNDQNHLMLFIPVGFAHGFATLKDHTIFQYKCSDVYHPETEGGILWSDPQLNIQWPISNPIISPKDTLLNTLSQLVSPF